MSGFGGEDDARVAVIYHSRARGLFVAIDEATGHELCAATTPEKLSYLLTEELRALRVKHAYLRVTEDDLPSK